MRTMPNVQTLALIGTYEPRRCGIATFTKDLRDAIAAESSHPHTMAIAIDDTHEGYPYPPEVRFQIQANRIQDYRLAADVLNINQIDLAVVQHEYGIFGGPSGNLILDMVRRLRMPVITTLHTVLSEPSKDQARVLTDLAKLSDRLVVMCKRAKTIMETVYDTPSDKIVFIPHGIPDVPFIDPEFYKDKFGLEGRTVLMTFGLLSPGKGLDVAINALPKIAEKHPEVIYMVLGAIHPHVFKREGNAYLASLERLAAKLGVSDNVVFHPLYVTIDELCSYLGAADIYVVPYPNRHQIVSGTLAYAMGLGKAVVSTPFWYAKEMIEPSAEDRSEPCGRLFPFDDSDALAETVNDLLDNPGVRVAMRKNAYMACRCMIWKEVAHRYIELGNTILRERHSGPRPIICFQPVRSEIGRIPEINMAHLQNLTDDTGILQHAIYAVPDRTHGYSTDDNARALIAVARHYDLTQDTTCLPLANRYMSFLHHAYDPKTRRFRNFLSYDRRWLDAVGSEDVHGRSLWALGQTVANAPNDAILSFASRLFCEALAGVETMHSPRAWAFTLVGIHSYLQRFSGDALARRARLVLAERLYGLFERNATDDWPWCEDTVTYDNAKLPHALILSGQWIPHHEMLHQGFKSLEWLVSTQLSPDGTVGIIGNQGWMDRSGRRARFDQQPIDVMSLVEACAEAYYCTREPVWMERARLITGWFLGSNDTQSMIYDYSTGGCRDGLHSNGPNLNEGAESTLAWLISLCIVYRLEAEATASEEIPSVNDAAVVPS